ncbi:MAG: OB-fold domain-containing protein [Rhodospirillaceae bacterium]|nr:OB-fold domain-containing protein [Rhodospirillaceae bacterium]
MRDFPAPAALADLVAPPTEAVRPQREALARGEILFQACAGCGRLRALVAPVCPYCRAREWAWRTARGGGKVVSWVRYHRAYLELLKPLVPYVALCVELDEGVRVFGRLAAADAEPEAGLRVTPIVERWADGGVALAFVPEAG